jgi:hypothetical protein
MRVESVFRILLSVFIVLFAFDAFAIGDSGPGGPCDNPVFAGYQKALRQGTAQDVEREAWYVVDADIERQKKQRGGYFLVGERPDRNVLFKKLISTGLGYCITGAEALRAAETAGNVEVAHWLRAHGAGSMRPTPGSN